MNNKERDRIVEEKGAACQLCGKVPMNLEPQLVLHHTISKKQGGTEDSRNLQLLCHKCHSRIHGHGVIVRLRWDLFDWLKTIDDSPTKALEIVRSTYTSNVELVEMVKELRACMRRQGSSFSCAAGRQA